MPTLPRVNLDDAQQQAIKANQAAEAGAAQFAGFTKDQILGMLRSTIPDFDKITAEASGNISDMLAGKLPGDVSGAVQNSAAAKSLGSGTAGSGFSRDLVARDLGLTSLDLTAKGLSSAESWFASTERMLAPAVSELSKMFITPMQEYSTTNEQNMQQFQRQWMVNQIGAMPDPEIRGWQDTFMQLSGRGGQPQSGNQYAATGGGGNMFGGYGAAAGYGDSSGNNEGDIWGGTSGTTININGAGGGGGGGNYDFNSNIDTGAWLGGV